jgi:hypothetical protein
MTPHMVDKSRWRKPVQISMQAHDIETLEEVVKLTLRLAIRAVKEQGGGEWNPMAWLAPDRARSPIVNEILRRELERLRALDAAAELPEQPAAKTAKPKPDNRIPLDGQLELPIERPKPKKGTSK